MKQKILILFTVITLIVTFGKANAQTDVIVTPVKIGNLEFAQHDFPEKMDWEDAKKACAALGGGWRLPTKEKLITLSKSKEKISDNWKFEFYWSSSEYDEYQAWYVGFAFNDAAYHEKYHYSNVHAVRTLYYTNDQKNNVIGKSSKVENLEIAQNDFVEQMNWADAKWACSKLGERWHLPTKEELNILYKNKDKIGGFSSDVYWSSSEDNSKSARAQLFLNGQQGKNFKLINRYVRAVRSSR